MIAVLPLAWRGTSCGHDFDFHLQSWVEVVNHWHEGVFYPHWDASANYGAGEPRFVFYPPLSWLVGAILGALLPWTWAPLAFVLIAFAACGISFFTMAREWITDDAAAVAGCLYLLNPYLMFVAYERTAYGELLSAAILPLLVLYGLRKKPALLPLALVIAALWLTNAPSAVMGCYLLVLLVLTAAIENRSYALIGRAAGAAAFGLGLAAFYVVPAAYEQRWVEIARAISAGMRVEDSFLFEHTGEAFHDQVLRTASWIAVAMLTTSVIAAIFSLRNRRTTPIRSPLIATLIAICILLLPISDILWRHTPELRFLQFTWRWLLVLGIVMALLVGMALRGNFVQAETRKAIFMRAVSLLAFATLMSSLAAFQFWQPCDEDDNIPAQRAAFHENGFEGTDEYTAANADNGDIQQDLPVVRVVRSPDADQADSSVAENPEWTGKSTDIVKARIELHRWNAENKEVLIKTQAPAYAVMRLMDYPAWHVTINGSPMVQKLHRDDGLLVVPLLSHQSTITVHYVATKDVEIGRAVSLLSLCILIAVLMWIRRERNLQLS